MADEPTTDATKQPNGGGTSSGSSTASNGQYRITSQSQTIQVLASGQVLDVEQVGFNTIPHNVYSQVLVPITDWQDGKTASYVNPVATAIEALLTTGGAASASYIQDVDSPSNLLMGYMDFVVSYTAPGSLTPMTTNVRIPISQLAQGATGAPADAIGAALSRLRATASL